MQCLYIIYLEYFKLLSLCKKLIIIIHDQQIKILITPKNKISLNSTSFCHDDWYASGN